VPTIFYSGEFLPSRCLHFAIEILLYKYRKGNDMTPKHDIRDQEKYQRLLSIFRKEDRWPDDMPALLADGQGQLYSGSHRYAAAKAAGLDDSEIPCEILPQAILDNPELAEWDDWDLGYALKGLGCQDLAHLAHDDF
jgi:hypothetical protein